LLYLFPVGITAFLGDGSEEAIVVMWMIYILITVFSAKTINECFAKMAYGMLIIFFTANVVGYRMSMDFILIAK